MLYYLFKFPHSSRCAKVFINWAAETGPWVQVDSLASSRSTTSSPSANCSTENSKFNKFLAVTRVAISRQAARSRFKCFFQVLLSAHKCPTLRYLCNLNVLY